MIRHIVLLKFPASIPPSTVAALWAELHGLSEHIGGMTHITAGPNDSPEDLDRGYSHGFTIDFTNRKDLLNYLEHPKHKQFGAKLVANAVGGVDGILVVDIDTV